MPIRHLKERDKILNTLQNNCAKNVAIVCYCKEKTLCTERQNTCVKTNEYLSFLHSNSVSRNLKT